LNTLAREKGIDLAQRLDAIVGYLRAHPVTDLAQLGSALPSRRERVSVGFCLRAVRSAVERAGRQQQRAVQRQGPVH